MDSVSEMPAPYNDARGEGNDDIDWMHDACVDFSHRTRMHAEVAFDKLPVATQSHNMIQAVT